MCQTRAPDLRKYVENMNNDLNWTSEEELFENADNGDLILMSGNTRGERTCRWCTGSMCSHVAMLFREKHPETGEDILYVWDSDLGQKTKEGPRVLRLDDKLKRYHGYPYLIWRKLKGPRPSTENILRVVQDYADYEFDEKILSWWTSSGFLSPLYGLVKHENKVFCSELIAATMQHEAIEMMDKSKKAAWYSPGNFFDDVSGLKKEYSYGNRYFVEFLSLNSKYIGKLGAQRATPI